MMNSQYQISNLNDLRASLVQDYNKYALQLGIPVFNIDWSNYCGDQNHENYMPYGLLVCSKLAITLSFLGVIHSLDNGPYLRTVPNFLYNDPANMALNRLDTNSAGELIRQSLMLRMLAWSIIPYFKSDNLGMMVSGTNDLALSLFGWLCKLSGDDAKYQDLIRLYLDKMYGAGVWVYAGKICEELQAKLDDISPKSAQEQVDLLSSYFGTGISLESNQCGLLNQPLTLGNVDQLIESLNSLLKVYRLTACQLGNGITTEFDETAAFLNALMIVKGLPYRIRSDELYDNFRKSHFLQS